MTPSPSISFPVPASPLPMAAGASGGDPPVGGLGFAPIPGAGLADALISAAVEPLPAAFLASCHRCAPGLAEPFFDDAERDVWALKHAETTGHLVHLTAENTPADGMHRAGLLRHFDHDRIWRWACLTCADFDSGAVAWNGPYDSGQLALASWRGHGRRFALVVTA